MAGESWESILGVSGPPIKGEPSEFESARSAFATMYTESNEVYQTFKTITAEGVPEDKLNNLPGQLLLQAVQRVDSSLSDLPRISGAARDVFAEHITKLNDLHERADEALGRAQTASATQRAAQAAVDNTPDNAANADDLNHDLDTADAAIDRVREEYGELVGKEDQLNAQTVDALDNIDFGALEAIAPTQQLIAFAIDPAGWLEWLTGPEGPAFEDLTALVPGLQEGIGNFLDGAMDVDLIANVIGPVFGFEKVNGKDFYTTNQHSLQSYFGFHDAYDKVGKLLGMDLDDEKFEFRTANGTEYRVELWKGGYGAGGAFGGEMGIYTREPEKSFLDRLGESGNPVEGFTRGLGENGNLVEGVTQGLAETGKVVEGAGRGLLEQIPGYYSSAKGVNQAKMTQTIYDKRTKEEYLTNTGEGADKGPGGEAYWNLGIRTKPGVSHENLGQRGTLELNDAEVGRALYSEMKRKGLEAHISEDGKTVSYTWE